jgi:DNA invertase Pin-like site-specific DNA recombinase
MKNKKHNCGEPINRDAVGYLRVSRESQEESGLGLEAQRSQIEAYAASRGLTIVRWYQDVVSGVSTLKDRAGLTSLLDGLEPEMVVLVAKRDRLSRDLNLALWCEKEISRFHCSIESCDGAGNGSSPTDVLLKNLILSFAAYERDLISDRTRSALQELKKTRKLGRPPFGHRFHANGQYETDPDTYPTFERMMELRREGFKFSVVARSLNKENHTSQTGKQFTSQMVRNLITRIEKTKEE